MKIRRKRLVLLVGVVAVVAAIATGTAIAVHAGPYSGGYSYQTIIQNSTDASSIATTAFVTLAGTFTFVSVPSSTTRLIDARFTAESSCAGGGAGNWCTARIVVYNRSTGSITELLPQSSTDFAFDSVGSANDYWESHAIERSIRLGPGTYYVYVQWRTTSTSTVFRLDDWHFAVDIHF